MFPFYTGLPTDVMTNSFHFFFDGVTNSYEQAIAHWTAELAEFYATIYASGRTMASYVQAASASVHWYRLDEPVPRVATIVPLNSSIVTGDTDCPTEVAVTASFQGDRIAGEPQARRRGRIYLGGLGGAGWIQSGSNLAFPVIQTTARVAVRLAMINLHAANTGTMNWVVWSPTAQESTLITNGWVDSSPDTQRRRSVESSLRTIWPIVP